MTHHIVTGPHPGHPGACVAQYNHHILNHTPQHHSNNHMNPHMQQQMTGQAHNGSPSWRPPMAPFPYYY